MFSGLLIRVSWKIMFISAIAVFAKWLSMCFPHLPGLGPLCPRCYHFRPCSFLTFLRFKNFSALSLIFPSALSSLSYLYSLRLVALLWHPKTKLLVLHPLQACGVSPWFPPWLSLCNGHCSYWAGWLYVLVYHHLHYGWKKTVGAPFQPFFQAPFQPQRRALPSVQQALQALIVSGPWPSNPPLSVAAALALAVVAVPARVALAANAAASAGSHFCGCGDLLQSHRLFCLDRRRDPDKKVTQSTAFPLAD